MAMANDTVTLELQGEVSLAGFAEAISRFSALVAALSEERAPGAIRWEIDDLEVGSATATARGVGQNGTPDEEIAAVAVDYLEVGRALERGVTVPFPASVQREAAGLAGVIDGGVSAVRFETAEADALVAQPTAAASPGSSPKREAAYGAVTGRVQTLSSRSRLRFVLYDALNDRPVSCYLPEGMEGKARDIWDKLATVEGWVTRDPATGRPLSVRRVSAINVMEEGDVRGYERARAALPRLPEQPRAEERIRRLRDAG